MGFAAPLGTPPDVVGRLHAAIGQATRLPELSGRLRDMGLDTVISASPEAFAEYAARERDRWGRLIREAGITAE
jgi:tripartite-type tricarboxylate transporter receptor subunit TctC